METIKSSNSAARIKEIILSTGNVNRPYVVRDIVFAADKIEVDLFDTIYSINHRRLIPSIIKKNTKKSPRYTDSFLIPKADLRNVC